MNEEEFFNRAINRICKDYDYNFANEFKLLFLKKDKEVERLNNIIDKFEDILKRDIKACNNKFENMFDRNYRRLILEEKLEQLQELKGSVSNE